ncbi:hypothetical protein B0H13DRAFT_2497244 [Mycena leptocephala]|nr:hypothetical protein B0H13DRAFT_2497244 [Mycena leptocephala]
MDEGDLFLPVTEHETISSILRIARRPGHRSVCGRRAVVQVAINDVEEWEDEDEDGGGNDSDIEEGRQGGPPADGSSVSRGVRDLVPGKQALKREYLRSGVGTLSSNVSTSDNFGHQDWFFSAPDLGLPAPGSGVYRRDVGRRAIIPRGIRGGLQEAPQGSVDCREVKLARLIGPRNENEYKPTTFQAMIGAFQTAASGEEVRGLPDAVLLAREPVIRKESRRRSERGTGAEKKQIQYGMRTPAQVRVTSWCIARGERYCAATKWTRCCAPIPMGLVLRGITAAARRQRTPKAEARVGGAALPELALDEGWGRAVPLTIEEESQDWRGISEAGALFHAQAGVGPRGDVGTALLCFTRRRWKSTFGSEVIVDAEVRLGGCGRTFHGMSQRPGGSRLRQVPPRSLNAEPQRFSVSIVVRDLERECGAAYMARCRIGYSDGASGRELAVAADHVMKCELRCSTSWCSARARRR